MKETKRRGASKSTWFMWAVGLVITLFVGIYAQSQANIFNQLFPGVPTDYSTVTSTTTGTTTLTGTSTSILTVTSQPPKMVTLAGTASSRTYGAGADEVRFTDESGTALIFGVVNGRYSANLTNGHTYTAEVHYPGYLGGWSTAVTFELAVAPNVPMPIRFDLQV